MKLHDDIVKNLTPYCDMDGVLVDAESGLKTMGRNWDQKHGYDFWINLPKFENTDDLWTAIHRIGKKPHILTAYQSSLGRFPEGEDAMIRNETCIGKYDWCDNNLDYYLEPSKFHCVYVKNKANYAKSPEGHPNLLIDDYKPNIERWTEAGGIGIRHTTIPDTINKLFDMGILTK